MMNCASLRAVLVPCSLLLAAATAHAATVYLDPAGNDEWSGRARRANADGTDGPVASLAGARDAVRRLRARVGNDEAVRVVVADGTYFLKKPVVFSPRDGGSPGAPVVYAADDDAKPILSAGRRITGFKADAGGVWRVSIPDVAAGKWYFEQLYVNNRWATRCRTPDEGYHHMLKPAEHGVNPLTGTSEDLGKKAFFARPRDIAPLLDLSEERLSDVTVVSYHSWEVGVWRVGHVDADTARLTITGAACWPFMQWKKTQRYHLENFAAALNAPGEWFLNRDGELSYIPLPGQTPANTEVYAPVADGFLRIAGEPELGMLVSDLSFEGLSFRHAGYTLPPEGHGDGQAAVSVGAVVECDAARSVTLRGCEISCIGPYAVWFRKSCRDCRVEKAYIHDMGAGGVKIGQGWGGTEPGDDDRTGHCVVDNCIINRGARLFRGSIGVWVGHSGDNRITHNDISDQYYSTVSLGWRWGYSYSAAVRNEVRFNHLHHYGQYVLSDLGAVYTLGPSKGTVVSDNVMHDGYSYDYGGWGMYTDEGSSEIVWERNLVYNMKTGCFHQHYGKDNIIRNCILAYSDQGQIQRSRVEAHRSFVFTNNIVYWRGGPLLTSQWNDDKFTIDRNIYWDESGEPITFAGMGLDEWRARGNDTSSLIADPKFVDASARDFRLRPDSPASKIGFKPFEYSKAGVYGDRDWIALAKGLVMPAFAPPPEPPAPPPMTFASDFESVSPGSPPSAARVHTEGKGDRIVVSDEFKAGGGSRCLVVADADGLEHSYNPHFYYSPEHTKGVTTFAFDIRVAADTDMYHEWRSGGNPYRVGPSLSIRQGRLSIDNRELMVMPTGLWVRLQITSGLGADGTGTWDLTVTPRGAKAQMFLRLPVRDKDWKRLDWLGFSSNATWKTTFYLDNLELSHR